MNSLNNTTTTLSAATDIEIVALLKSGSQEALREVVTRYSEKVHNLSMRISRNEEDTEEIMQDVFVTVFRKIHAFEGKSAFSSWLYRITVNTAFMKLRKRRQTPAVSLEDLGSGVTEAWVSDRSEDSDITFVSSRHEMRALLDSAVNALPEEYRKIFVLRDVDGLSNQEVGEILNLSVPAVKSRLHRARLVLRKCLARYYADYRNDSTIDSAAKPMIGEYLSM